jgi:hypothetical protein
MYQPSLLDDAGTHPRVAVVGIAGSTPTLTPLQRKFNQLVQRLRQQRQELEGWQAFRRGHDEQLAGLYEPAVARLRERRLEMLRFLDHSLDGNALRGRERTTVREMLEDLLEELLADSHDAELVGIHDKYAPQSFVDLQQEKMDFMRTLASEEFGIDVDTFAGNPTPENIAEWLDEQVAESRQESQRARPRKESAKARAKDELREAAAQSATRAIRDVFRKLVSELHPDRETDPAEQVRKTELMQRVNQAYEAGDLLALLELQLSIEQIDAAALAGLAEERLGHYIHVLEAQSRGLREELTELLAPFLLAVPGASPGNLTPAKVQRALEKDVRELDRLSHRLAADLERFKDIEVFKREIKTVEIDPFAELVDDPDFANLVFAMTPNASRRRPKKSRRHRR